MLDSQSKTVAFKYIFAFPDNTRKEINVKLDGHTLRLLREETVVPHWAALDKFRCEHCPLDPGKHFHCPVAVNIMDLVEHFQDAVSCDEVELTIETPRRTYVRKTSLQNGVSALLGIFMATSGCPVFDKLKPMVRYHLPFAGPEETAYRTISMYLLAQFFRQRQGKTTDWDMRQLNAIFKDVVIANRNICAKLRGIVTKDALLNALIKLNAFVGFTSLCLDDKILAGIEQDFTAYF